MTPQPPLHSPLGHFYSQPVPFWPFQPEPVHWPGRRGYVPRTFGEVHGAAILGNLCRCKIAANMEIQICIRFILEVCIKTLLYLL